MWGIWRSLQKPDSQHPYGFSREKYAWSLVSGVGIFFLGGGVSLYHGISGLMVGAHHVGDLTAAWWVLGGSLVFETTTMTFAFRQINKSAKAAGVSFFEYVRRGADPTTVQVLLEDCAAITGVAIAGTCLTLSNYLNSPMIDNFGSISIGVLLGSVAAFLVRRNIASLVEHSMPAKGQNDIVKILETDPVVRSVHDVKTTTLGPEWVRFKAEILFNGEEITRRYIARTQFFSTKAKEELALIETEQDLENWMIKHGAGVVSTLGSEVDRLELNIKAKHPEVKHCDLEIL
ncbi:hypothetical protein HK096_005954 [Nowakowskiella sp. JEL0078]|nr:hypothetical protein HK096_005954 [Nowakowskiella sp. JEL0078]